MRAKWLRPMLLLLTVNRYKQLRSIHHDEPVMVYNIAVCDGHTYFVGENNVLVHNICPPSDTGEPSGWNTSDNRNGLWNKGKLKEHFAKHGIEVGANTSADYSQMAIDFGTKQSSIIKLKLITMGWSNR